MTRLEGASRPFSKDRIPHTMAINFEAFEQKLNAFVFFHLGADTTCKIEQNRLGVKVTLQHPRVHPFSFQIENDTLMRMLANNDEFEDFMLDKLARHRKSQ